MTKVLTLLAIVIPCTALTVCAPKLGPALLAVCISGIWVLAHALGYSQGWLRCYDLSQPIIKAQRELIDKYEEGYNTLKESSLKAVDKLQNLLYNCKEGENNADNSN